MLKLFNKCLKLSTTLLFSFQSWNSKSQFLSLLQKCYHWKLPIIIYSWQYIKYLILEHADIRNLNIIQIISIFLFLIIVLVNVSKFISQKRLFFSNHLRDFIINFLLFCRLIRNLVKKCICLLAYFIYRQGWFCRD